MYPTKEEILATEITFDQALLTILEQWKEIYYTKGKWAEDIKNSKGMSRTKENKIVLLVLELAKYYDCPVRISVQKDVMDCYDPKKKTIHLNKDRISIITTLHEFAHHLYGSSELEACRWSIQLFKKTFPQAYAKLIWDGHMLKTAR